MTPKQTLIAARQLLVEKGWVPYGGTYSKEGPNCVMTAIAVVEDDDSFNIRNLLREVLRTPFLVEWNDSQISIEPILAAFDAAIERAEG